MRLITHCPTCGTLFKVAPDQLLISDGWVRCGQCKGVFDAARHLLSDDAEHGLDATPAGPLASASPDLVAHDASQDAPFAPATPFLPLQTAHPRWHKTLIQVALGTLAGLLLMGLIGQIVFHERDRIAAYNPGAKPGLMVFCKPLGCRLYPLKKIQSIAIESSALSKVHEDAYRINLVLKNTADTALAVPALEVTITNSLDQPVIRRVLTPSDFDAQHLTLAAFSELPLVFSFSIKAPELSGRVTGYRLLAFYP